MVSTCDEANGSCSSAERYEIDLHSDSECMWN